MCQIFPSKKDKGKGNRIPKQKRKLFRKKKRLSEKLLKCKSKHSMRIVRNKIEIIEAEIAKNYNNRRNEEEEKVIGEIKNDPATFYNYAKKYSKTKDSIGPLMDSEGNIHSNCKNIADLLKN